jgi:hypothetical protein
MTLNTAPQASPQFARLIGATLFGFVLVVAGLAMAYLPIATPVVAELVPGASAGGSLSIGFGVWSFSLIAGGALLAAGTNRLAWIVASVKSRARGHGPATRALGATSDELAVASNVIPSDGRPVPELVIGSFGVAVIHELSAASRVRGGPAAWDTRARNSWEPIDDPLDAAMRDAERVRRWLAGADLEFVVRVYAALVVSDRVVQRSPACAVISANQISAWIASLPRQRSLTVGRRAWLLARSQPSTSPVAVARGGW